jgi:hypothetical protein
MVKGTDPLPDFLREPELTREAFERKVKVTNGGRHGLDPTSLENARMQKAETASAAREESRFLS